MTFPNLSQTVTVLVGLSPILAIILPFLYQLLMSKLPAQQRALLQEIVQAGVKAAELSNAPGDVKKQLATQSIAALCKDFGLNASDGAISTLIEAAVYEIHQLQHS